MTNLFDIPIIVDDTALCETEWRFPNHRFVEYEKKDEHSCRVLGIGHEVRVPQCLQFGNKMICNTPFLKLLDKEIEKRNNEPKQENRTGGHGWLYR